METTSYYDKKAKAVNDHPDDKPLQYYQHCLLKSVNYVTRDLAPHRDEEGACSYISKGTEDKKKKKNGEEEARASIYRFEFTSTAKNT